MDWKNVNLENGYERDKNILDPYTFNTILLEIHCNIKDINSKTIIEQFEASLKSNIDSAREVFNNNLENVLKKAIKDRKS